ncbi:MAG: glycosyltransferase [Bacteroidota bacterium]
MKFDITIPVLNEEETLARQITTLVTYLEGLPSRPDYTVSIADNGSTDRTRDIAAELMTRFPTVRLVTVPERGVGRGLKATWDASDADVVGYIDLDFSTPIEHLPQMFAAFADPSVRVLSASRYLPGSQVVGRRFVRTVTSIGLNMLLKLLLHVRFTDAMAGFKFVRRDLYDELRRLGLDNNGWFFNAEILIRSEWLGIKVVELPVRWVDDPNSKVQLAATIRNYLDRIFQLRREKAIAMSRSRSNLR